MKLQAFLKHIRPRGFSMPVLEATATAVGAPLVNHALQELRSRVEKYTWLADLHKELNKTLVLLLTSQKDKDEEASSGAQKDTSHVYRDWTNSVSNIEKQVNSLNEEYEEVRKKNFLQSWNIAVNLKKRIKEALEEAIKLLEKCPEKILVDYAVRERVIKEAGVKSFVEYPTLHKAFQEIKALLKDTKVKCVALYGQRGVGKTTIMKHLNNHHFYDSSDKKEFDMVIFIKVAIDEKANECAESLHILQKIAYRIKEGIEGDESEVAGRIRSVLKDKRYLLILDGIRYKPNGIWEKLDISKDSKVVITTHYPLAFKSKYVDRTVELKPLKPEESWKMFREIAGEKVLLPNDIPIAQRVCERFCCCLPLLIYHIASSFAQEAPPNWLKALNELMPWPKVEVNGLAELYEHLKISYNLLSLSKQKCFLYASLYPANKNIYTHYLVECCIVQGFLSDVEADTGYNTLRPQVTNTILRHLINVSFLEEGEEMRYVKMNYFYWQLASYILSKDSNLEGRTYVDNEKHEEERPIRQDSRQHAKWFSRIGSKSDDLPTNQNCVTLEALLLQRNMKLGEFPPNCFESMGNLLVLNLYCTKISKLPSLKGLTNLKAFYLNGCSQLKIDPDEIELLKHLEVFDIRDTKVNFVPCLESLRCLRISCIASGNYHGFSVLQKLEELTIEVKYLQKWCNDAQCIIGGVASLQNLTTLRCSFYSSEILEEFLKASEAWRHEKTQSLRFKFLCDVKTKSI
ncbi:hypothetical protein K1719_021673 [Acacia pycnantha]|nr:hypothetical protein K1719_021673 [Acacia pycnantha]